MMVLDIVLLGIHTDLQKTAKDSLRIHHVTEFWFMFLEHVFPRS
jgi:hypothetical protein